MKQKVVYQTDHAGIFIGKTVADESPLEKGVFLLPAGCVEKAPPAFVVGQRARWVDGDWLLERIVVDEVAQAPEPSPEQIKASLREAIQCHLDATARQYGYDSMLTAVSYATEPAIPKFQQEGKALSAWRSQVWAYALPQLDAIEAGERPQPTAYALIEELPVFVAPDA